MKKIILMTTLLMATVISYGQEKKSVKGLFEGYDGTVYSFSDELEAYFLFEEINPDLLKKFDLQSDEYLYSDFKIMYITSENEDGDTVLRIVDLVLLESNDED